MNGTAKGSENMLMAGMAGAFVLVVVSVLEALPLFKVRLGSGIGMVAAILALLGFVAIGLGFLAVHKNEDKPMAQFAGFGFMALALIALIGLVARLAGSFKLAFYMLYAVPLIGAAAFGLAGLAVNQTKELWGNYAKITSSGFYAIAIIDIYLFLTLIVRSLGGRYTLYVGYAFLALKLMAFVTAGLGFMEMKKRAA